MSRRRFVQLINHFPVNLAVFLLCMVWVVPTLGLLVTSFRPREAVNTSGWWTVLDTAQPGADAYAEFCASCHDGQPQSQPATAGPDLRDPTVIAGYTRSLGLARTYSNVYDGRLHVPEEQRPTLQQTADILDYLRTEAGLQTPPSRLTIDNYVDVMVGYAALGDTYRQACREEDSPAGLNCNFLEAATTRSDAVLRGLINSLLVAVPATIIPILIAAFASFALSWMDFNGRRVLFALLVGLQIVPLQMVLVPIFRLYTQLGLNGTFFGVWLFHTGFGLPYAIYIVRNFIGGLPPDLFESAYIDGANHFAVFRRIVMPLALPAIAALGIYQFLWVWNDLLVALIFLGNEAPVLTYLLNQLTDSLGGGWQRMTAAAFISIVVPLLVFFAFQRYFVRGLLAGAVKG